MKSCPGCGREVSSSDRICPSCKTKIKTPFTIREFLWDNFRLFTMVGVTGTMISLIPNMGTRILGVSWITGSDNYLPLFLSIIILFGTIFLTICFLMIFCLIFDGRTAENALKRITIRGRTLITGYEGDFQRFILLLCLVPMWLGMTLFFILLMPQIPNRYSWFFAVITLLACIPLVVFSILGWNIGKKIIGKIPGMESYPRLSSALFLLLVIAILAVLCIGVPLMVMEKDPDPRDIRISADQQYFSPQISSAKGLRLEISNISGQTYRQSRHTWSADYGYFVRVIPSTSEVTILGNPVYNDTFRDIYWTYAEPDPARNNTPVTITVYLYPLHDNQELTRASLSLDWYTNNIVHVSGSSVVLP